MLTTLFLSLFLNLFARPHLSSYERMVDRVSTSVVHILAHKPSSEGEDQEMTCTGFVVRPNLVLTAEHCLGDKMSADGAYPEVIRTDDYYDLLLLKVPTKKAPLRLSNESLERFQSLTAIGWAFGWTKLSVLSERVLLVDHQIAPQRAPGIIVQNGFIGGMSGGPVVNDAGEVVAIVQESNQSIGYGVGVQIIRVFLLGVD